MKRNDRIATVGMLAAFAIIGASICGLRIRHTRHVKQRKELEEAQQNWEGEGGAVLIKDDEVAA